MADVRKGAGLTVGGFYAHFLSKEMLVDDALRLTAGRTRERLFAGLDAKDASDRADVVLKRYLSTAHRDQVDEGCPFPAVIGEVSTTAHEHAPVLAEQIETFASELSPHLSSGASAAAGASRRSSNACERPSTRRAR